MTESQSSEGDDTENTSPSKVKKLTSLSQQGEEKKDDTEGATSDEEPSQSAKHTEEASDASGPSSCETNMYEALWTNGPKEAIEFFDYTFDEHFGNPLPVYMPRQPLLEYMICRVTRHQPTFFDDYVSFNTTVKSVKYDDEYSKFVVVTVSNETQEETTELYDKCIWAAGDCGIPNIPRSMTNMLEREKFIGKWMHSSSMEDFNSDVAGRNVLLVGDAYSAEDLALMAIKRGVGKVFVCSRNAEGAASSTSAWPMNKVEVIRMAMPTEVINNGRGIRLTEVKYDCECWNYMPVEGGKVIDIAHVDTVIFCTGYTSNMSMLDESLRVDYDDATIAMPPGWKMKSNPLTEEFGDIEPYPYIWPGEGTIAPGVYRGALISNPSMMFLQNTYSEVPLMEIDVVAWLLLGYVTGTIELPSAEEMERRNHQQTMDEMDVPNLRYNLDVNYYKRWVSLRKEHWSRNLFDPRARHMEEQEEDFLLRLVARDRQTAGYPDDIGTYEKLNERGRMLLEMQLRSNYHRYDLDPTNEQENTWKTFRDCDCSANRSIHTGTRAVPLKSRWLELDDTDEDLLDYYRHVEDVATVGVIDKIMGSPSIFVKNGRIEPNPEVRHCRRGKPERRGSDDISHTTPSTEDSSETSSETGSIGC